MKNVKRFIALVLALVMSAAAFATIAATNDPLAWTDEAVSQLEKWGIAVIGNKKADPISRDEFVYWMAKVYTHQLDDDAWKEKVLETELTFADVSETQHHYTAIAHAVQQKWVLLDSDPDVAGNKFRPDDTLTLAEMSKLIVRLMEYGDEVEGDEADWQYQYIDVANLLCQAFDNTFLQETGTYNVDYPLTYGEAAYVVWTIMNKGVGGTDNGQILTKKRRVNLADWFVNNQSNIGSKTFFGVVTDADNKKVTVFVDDDPVVVDIPADKWKTGVVNGYACDVEFGLDQQAEADLTNVKSVSFHKAETIDSFYYNTNTTANKYTMKAKNYTAGKFSVEPNGVVVGGTKITKIYAGVDAYVAGDASLTPAAAKIVDPAHGATKFLVADYSGNGTYDTIIVEIDATNNEPTGQEFLPYVVVYGKKVTVPNTLTGESYTVGAANDKFTVVVPGGTGNGSNVAGNNNVLPAFFTQELPYTAKVGYILNATTANLNGQYTIEIVDANDTTKTYYMPVNEDYAADYVTHTTVTINGATLEVEFGATSEEAYEELYPLAVAGEESIASLGVDQTSTDYAKVASWMVNKYVKFIADETTGYILYATTTLQDPTNRGLVLEVAKTTTGDNTFNITIGSSVEEWPEAGGIDEIVTKEVRGAASSLEDWANYEHYNRILTEKNFIDNIAVNDKLEGWNLTYGEFVADAGTQSVNKLSIFKYVAPGDVEEVAPDSTVFGHITSKFPRYENQVVDNTKTVLKDDAATAANAQSAQEKLAAYLNEFKEGLTAEGLIASTFTTADGTQKQFTMDELQAILGKGDSFIQQYSTQTVSDPYYKLEQVNGKYQFVRYWTNADDKVVVGISVPKDGPILRTYIAVINEDGSSVIATSQAEIDMWENLEKDYPGADAKYIVKENGVVYRINTVKLTYLVENGQIQYDVYYAYDDAVSNTVASPDADDLKVVVYEDMLISNTVKAEARKEGDVLQADPVPVDYIPGDYTVTIDGKKYAADDKTLVVVMQPEFDPVSSVSKAAVLGGKRYTLQQLIDGRLGVWATRLAVTFRELGDTDTYYVNVITVIGETFDLDWQRVPDPVDPDPGQPDPPPQPPVDNRPVVYLANGETVVEQYETGNNYVVRSKYTAQDLRTGEDVGSIYVAYSTYLEAKKAQNIEVVLQGNQIYRLVVGTQEIDVTRTEEGGTIKTTIKESGIEAVTATITNVDNTGKVTGTYKVGNAAATAIKTTTQFRFFYIDYDITVNRHTGNSTWVQLGVVLAETDAELDATREVVPATTAYAAVTTACTTAKNKVTAKTFKDSDEQAIKDALAEAVAKYYDGQLWGKGYSAAWSYFAKRAQASKQGQITVQTAFLVDGVIVVVANPIIAQDGTIDATTGLSVLYN